MTFIPLSCRRCGTQMKHTVSADGKKITEFWRCPKCWFETKHVRIVFKEEKAYVKNQKKTNSKKDVKNNAGKRRKSTGVCRKHR